MVISDITGTGSGTDIGAGSTVSSPTTDGSQDLSLSDGRSQEVECKDAADRVILVIASVTRTSWVTNLHFISIESPAV